MILRIIAFTMILCLSLGTFSLANQKSTSNLPTLKWEQPIKTRMFIGIGVGLLGTVLAINNAEKSKWEQNDTGLIIATIGFGYAFWNWMKLNVRIARTQITEIMDSWIGHHQSELIASWGPPEKIASDGKGGTILDYSHYKGIGQTGYMDAWGRIHIRQTGYKAIRLFYVNSDGIIYDFKWGRL